MTNFQGVLISVILPSYNGHKYIQESIDSLLAQTYENWELILVDDCSTDNTWAIMQEYHKRFPEKIQCIHHQINRKLPTALNTGFAASRGDYLTWTSDDNLYKPNALEKMVRFLDDHPDVGLVYADYSIIDENGTVISDEIVKDPAWILNWSIVRGCFLYRRDVYLKIGNYSEEKRLTEDHDYWIRTYLHYKISPLHENLYQYRYHASSLSSTNAGKVQILKEKNQLEYIKRVNTEPAIKKDLYINLIASARKRKEYKNALQRLFLFGSEYPFDALKYALSYVKLKTSGSSK